MGALGFEWVVRSKKIIASDERCFGAQAWIVEPKDASEEHAVCYDNNGALDDLRIIVHGPKSLADKIRSGLNNHAAKRGDGR